MSGGGGGGEVGDKWDGRVGSMWNRQGQLKELVYVIGICIPSFCVCCCSCVKDVVHVSVDWQSHHNILCVLLLMCE